MDFVKIILSSFFSIIVLFFLTKIIGNRQMSQLSMFDYVNGITIGSIAAEAATNLEKNPLYPFIAMLIYAFTSVLLSYISTKKINTREFIEGKTWMIFKNGKFYIENLKKQRLDVSEILAECRTQGYFNLQDIEMIMLEHNGKMSILPKSDQRNTTPADFNMMPQPDVMPQIVIYEGMAVSENLKRTGNNEEWLEKQLKEQKLHIKDVFIGMCDGNNKLNIYKEKT